MEIEAFAVAVLAAQMQNETLDSAPVWTDLRTFDGRAWRGAVDCILAGFPCQDISSAGKRAGIRSGKRSGLWYSVARIVREVRPRYVFLENVDDIVVRGRGLDIVLGDLAALGFAAAWGVFSAAEVCAPHQRERWFCLAVSESGGRRELREPSRSAVGIPKCAGLEGLHADRSERAGGFAVSRPAGALVADADMPGRNGRGGSPAASQARADDAHDALRRICSRASLGQFPPGPAERDAWQRVVECAPWLAPAIAQPTLRQLADGLVLADRVDLLRLLGNGVVPQQAERAYRTLRDRLMKEGLW